MSALDAAARAIVERVIVSELADDIAIIDSAEFSPGIRAWARTRTETACDLGRRLGFPMDDLRYLALREIQARQEYLRRTVREETRRDPGPQKPLCR